MGRVAILAAAACLALVALPATAGAQAPGQHGPPGAYQPPPPRVTPVVTQPPGRSGFVIGFGIGPGSIEAVSEGYENQVYEGLSLNFAIGGMLSPRFALLGELWSVIHSEEDEFGDDLTLSHDIALLAGQYWLTPRFWIKGGIGRASYRYEDYAESYDSDSAPAVMGALGYELSHSRTFGLDLQLRFGAADYDEGELHNAALALGFNWF